MVSRFWTLHSWLNYPFIANSKMGRLRQFEGSKRCPLGIKLLDLRMVGVSLPVPLAFHMSAAG